MFSYKPGGSAKTPKHRLNHLVFWPPFLLLLLAVGLNFVWPEKFGELTTTANHWVLSNFGWMFSLCAFAAVLLSIVICFSRFGAVRLGGRDAKPLMPYWNWFAITVCTTIAVGILLWATAEPISHFVSPPGSKGIEPKSPEAAKFAMSTMYLHWTFTPYAIYAVASLAFAFAYYNMRQPYSLGSPLAPLLGRQVSGGISQVIDGICLYSLVAGMAASLGGGILILAGGLHYLMPSIPDKSRWVWALIALVIIATFVISSASGLMRGIRILSSINTYALFALVLFVLIFGPTVFILTFGIETFGIYLTQFFEMNTFGEAMTTLGDDSDNLRWVDSWTIFYWAVWFAWTPVTACFLGQIAYGRTVREFMAINFVLPSLFGAFWMAVFSGTAINYEVLREANLAELLQPDADGQSHYELVTFKVFSYLPLPIVLVVFYVISTFICFVTSADSNTTAMAAISSTGISPDAPEGGTWVKVAWGVLVGTVAWVMISFRDINGIKIISVLGGFPACILIFLVMVSLAYVVIHHERLNLVDNERLRSD